MTAKVAILGGGISGVACARFLLDAGLEVEVLEADARAGGLVRSDVVDGYVFDRAGGHILFTKDKWCRDLLHGLFRGDELVATERNTKILYRGRFVHYPFENGLGDLEPEERLQCLKGYIEAWVARKSGAKVPDNFKDWVMHRMGAGIAAGFMNPYNEKIWKADLATLGIDWVEGRVPDAPLEDVLRAALGQRVEGYVHQLNFHYPRFGGFEEIFQRLLRPVRPFLRTGVRVERVEKRGERFLVNGTEYDRVVSTVPLPILANLLEGLDANGRAAALALQHRSLTSFLFGIEAGSAKPFSWIYLPHASQGPANRVTYLSNYSPMNAPKGRASLLAEVTHNGPLAVDGSYLANLRDALGKEGLLRSDGVTTMHHYSNEWAYILFDRDFTKKRALAIESIERLGVYPLGRFGRFDYHNSDQCVISAREIAARVVASIR